ncbi:MAG: FAD-dependent oxidoreductase, partial [Mycobacteriales bacterium]
MSLGHPHSLLSGRTRARELSALADGEPVDVLVVGGGITGAGVALDAASRGLSTALLERRDLGFGTSRWSSKLVHGGLRYLASGEFGLAYESARERHRLMSVIAPHLVAAQAFVVPFNSAHSRWEAGLSRTGIGIGDGLRVLARTPGSVLPGGGRLSPQQARELFPALGEVRSAVLHWDGQLLDDARLVVGVARTAAAFGARILTRAEVTRVEGDQVSVRDGLSGESLTVRARTVVLATGVYTGQLASSVALRPSRGTHLVLRADALGSPRVAVNLLLPRSRSRWLLVLPQPDRVLSETATVLVGLTDDPVEQVDERPLPGPADEELLLSQLAVALG